MSNFVILICAAGASSRMGNRDKLLLTVDGTPMLRRIANICGEIDAQTWVALPKDAPDRAAALSDSASFRWSFTASSEGLSGTLRAAGERLIQNADKVMIVLADMPDLGLAQIARMRMAPRDFPDAKIWRAVSEDGKPGHPVVFDKSLFPDFADLMGDDGAKQIVAKHSADCVDVPLTGQAAITDIDTPEDWSAWKSGQL